MRIDLNIIRFKTTKGYLLQTSSLKFHRQHPYILVYEIINYSSWQYNLCKEHNAHIKDVEYQDALLRTYNLTDKKP